MSIALLLQDLRSAGISLSLQGENLKINAPQGALDEALKQRLREHKAALMRWLQESKVAEELALPICVPDPEHGHSSFPLSDMQLGFYMGDDPYMEFHVRPHYYIEKNQLNLNLLAYQAAWDKALLRHRQDIVIVRADGYLQRVENPAPLRCKVTDLGEADAETVQASLQQTRADMMRAVLPLDRWPWLDLRVTQWREKGGSGVTHQRIHYNHNNFFSDGYGTTRLLQEIDQYYAHPETTLPPLQLSFRDAALTLSDLAESPAGRIAQNYWESRLPNLPEPPALPMNHHLDRRCRSRLQRREGFLSEALWTGFKNKATALGITPSNAVFCAYAEVLSAWSNSRHFILSNMMTRRLNTHPEIRDIIGNFASLYPLEIDFRENKRFLDRARDLQERVILDAKHLHWGGMQVMQALNRQKSSPGTAAVPFVIGSGLFMEGFERADFSCLETSQVMLDHQFWELTDGSYYYVWDCLEEFFPSGVIDAMWQALQNLLTQLAQQDALWQAPCLNLIPTEMLQKRLAVCPPQTPAPQGRLHDALQARAKDMPEQAALISLCGDLEHRLSYADLDLGSDHLARALQTHAICHGLVDTRLCGKTVAIVAHRNAALFQAVIAVLKAGAAYVPIDPDLPDDRRNYILENCQAVAVLCERQFEQALLWPEHLSIISIEDTIAQAEDRYSTDTLAFQARHPAAPHDLAYLIYTSGSTGRPKGVMIEHGAALNTVLDVNQGFDIHAGDRFFGVSSFGFDLSVYDLFGPMLAGASLVYPDPGQSLNPSHWLDVMLNQRITVWNSAPPLATLLIEAVEQRAVRLPDLRLVLLSGDWIPIELPNRIRSVAPNAKIISMGGATEASIWSIIYPIDAIDPSWRSIPYGYPMQNQSWHILDEQGRDLPEWSTGELYIGGIGLARGYWQDTEKTNASFIAHPRTGERIYRTGDTGRYLPGGAIEFLGRKDTQVKISGYRVELGEIESVLMQASHIRAAVATVQTSATGQAQLVAFVVPTLGISANMIDCAALRLALAQQLPEYMVPKHLALLERLPLSPNGKLDRKNLPQLSHHANSDHRSSTHESRAAQTPTEHRLLDIWCRVLRQASLTVLDDFLECGGQSIDAVRIIGAIRENFAVSLSLGVIWQQKNVAAIAAQIDLQQQSHAPHLHCPLQHLKTEGLHAALFLVHPAGGHVMCYQTLARLLNRPVHAFQAPGLDEHSEAIESIPALAKIYVELLLQQQSHGDIHLGGWSSGALIAFEMVAQLRALGREVVSLILIDCPSPHPENPVDPATLLAWFLEDLALDLPITELVTGLQLSHQNSKKSSDEALQQVAEKLTLMAKELPIDLAQLQAIYWVFLGIVRGAKKYVGSKIDADIFLIRAGNGIVSEFAAHPCGVRADWGWSNWTSGQVQTLCHEGNHYQLLKEPAVTQLAPLLENYLLARTGTKMPSASVLQSLDTLQTSQNQDISGAQHATPTH